MRRAKYLYHVTTTTGHSRRSWRDEIGDDIIARLRTLVAQSREPGGAIIPAVQPSGCRLTMVYESQRCCALAIHDPDGAPLVTMGVATHARCGAALWRRMHDQGVHLISREARPQTPWCAVTLHTGALLYLPPSNLLPALADFERSVAWAWIEDRAV